MILHGLRDSLEWECYSPSTQTLPSLHTFLDPFDDIGAFDENYNALIYSSLSPTPPSLDYERKHILPDPGYESGGKRNNVCIISRRHCNCTIGTA